MKHRRRVGPGARLTYQGELIEIVEIRTASGGNIAIVKTLGTNQIRAVAFGDILMYRSEQPHEEAWDAGDDEPVEDVAATILGMLNEAERNAVRDRARHIREVLTGFRDELGGSSTTDEPKPQYDPALSLSARYETKAVELGVDMRTIQRMVAEYRAHGEAGLARGKGVRVKSMPSVDSRWRDTAVEVMVESVDQSRPSRTAVIKRTNARVIARFGPDAVPLPSRATAFRMLTELETKHPTFRLSTKRNRDIAERNPGVYGKLRPTRPGEYMLMDTTRLDVFAMDPLTLRWCQVELTVAMDWYTRCITGLRLTPVSTKSVDVATVLYQAYRPPAAPSTWPREATWPEHGIPCSVLLDTNAIEREGVRAVGPAIVPETLIVDHGKVYASDHTNSVCQRMGISVQPARLRTGRDKGPIERFFRTIREDLLQYLPGYKGPDIHSRGQHPEGEAHFYINDLEAIIREWIAVVYHRRPHAGLVEAALPGLELSPVTMFEHGLARAGYIEAPRSPDLAYEFLAVKKRTIQPYGIEIDGRKYKGRVLNGRQHQRSPYPGGLWPVHCHPDDISRIYFRDPDSRTWHTLVWEHAGALDIPFSDEALQYGRKLAKQQYTYPNDELAMELLLERWNLGLGRSVAERRIVLRQSREDELRCAAAAYESEPTSKLPSVRHALSESAGMGADEPASVETATVPGDDDDSPEDFYADAWEDA